jgi:hypothetical protein
MYLATPVDAPARSTGHSGLVARLSLPLVGPGYGQARAGLPHTASRPGAAGHARPNGRQSLGHMGRGRGARAGGWGPCAASRGRATARSPRAPGRRPQHRGPKRGAGRGGSGDKPPQGAPGIASLANQGDVCAPGPVAPVHATARGRLPQGLQALQPVAQQVGWDRTGASLNLAGGLDAAQHRQGLVPAGRMPNLHEPPRHRQPPQRGRHRLGHAAIQALRRRGARPVAWEDTCQRLRLRLERLQQRHYGMQGLAYPLLNLRTFCGT